MEITDENVDKPVDEKLLGGDVPDELAEPKKPEAEAAATAKAEADAKAAEDKKAADDASAAAVETADLARDKQIPRARFDEVNTKYREEQEGRKQEREARERAEAELAALKAGPAPDINAMEKEYTEAVFAGDTDKAVDLRTKISAEQIRIATDAAYTRADQQMTRRESDRAYASAYAQTLVDHPFLDPKTGNPEAIAEALEWRDFLVAKGVPSHEALAKAAAKVAPAYADQEVKDEPAPDNVTQIDPRKKAALARNAKDAVAQPAAAVAGVGNRAVPAPPAPANQADWEKLSEAEREKLLA